MGDVENLDAGETHLAQEEPGGSDVGAVFPWAAAAIEDDGPIAGQAGYAATKRLEAIGSGSRAGILGAGNVGLVEEHARAHLEDERMAAGLQSAMEGLRLDELIVRNHCGADRGRGAGAGRESGEGDDAEPGLRAKAFDVHSDRSLEMSLLKV